MFATTHMQHLFAQLLIAAPFIIQKSIKETTLDYSVAQLSGCLGFIGIILMPVKPLEAFCLLPKTVLVQTLYTISALNVTW